VSIGNRDDLPAVRPPGVDTVEFRARLASALRVVASWRGRAGNAWTAKTFGSPEDVIRTDFCSKNVVEPVQRLSIDVTYMLGGRHGFKDGAPSAEFLAPGACRFICASTALKLQTNGKLESWGSGGKHAAAPKNGARAASFGRHFLSKKHDSASSPGLGQRNTQFPAP